LWGLSQPQHPTQVTVVGGHRRSRRGIEVTQVKRLDARDRRVKNGIPVTAPARTAIDFAGIADSDDELERAVSEARARRLIKDGEIEQALARAGNHRGVAAMRAFLEGERETGFTRKEAERRMRRITREAGLPQPLCNARVGRYEVDFLWPAQRLVVEVDGYAFHGHRRAFERDRHKDQVLVAAGYRVMRVTWRQIRDEPLRVAAAIASALAFGDAGGAGDAGRVVGASVAGRDRG
jgi:very-short-patch-repair endonuclease